MDSILTRFGVDMPRRIHTMYANAPTNRNINTERRNITKKLEKATLSGTRFGFTVPM